MATVFGAGAAKRSGSGAEPLSNATSNPTAGPPGRNGGARRPGGIGRDGGRPGSLTSLINEQIIPRLLMTHSHGAQRVRSMGAQLVDPAEVMQFASLPLQLEADELLGVVEAFIARGVAVESIFVDLLAPSARRLGQHWEDDDCDFLDVTMGLWRLQEVMREITMRYPPAETAGPRGRTALFCPMPGDEHSLGALMVEEVFVRAGWQTEVLLEPKRKELLQIVASRHFDLLGLTLSCDWPIGTVSDLICAIRSVARSPDLQILIGGRMVNANPAIVIEAGADGSALDARSALAMAEKLVTGTTRFDRTCA